MDLHYLMSKTSWATFLFVMQVTRWTLETSLSTIINNRGYFMKNIGPYDTNFTRLSYNHQNVNFSLQKQ